MKTILLTGATGFLGSHLLESLLNKNYNVVILKRSFSNTRRIDHFLTEVISYDIDHISLEKPFEENKIDVIIHTATSYGRKGESLSHIADANLVIPLKLLELALSYDTDTFFNTDTIAYKYLNSYSLSKKQFLEWLKQFSNRIRVVNMKIEHIYGPKDDEKKFVTWLIQELLKNNPLDLTKGEQKRDFIFIDDVVDAYMNVLEQYSAMKESFSEFGIGSGELTSIRHLVKQAHHLTKSSSKLNFGAVPYRENEIMESKTDISKLADLGWEPAFSLKKGLASTIDFERMRHASH